MSCSVCREGNLDPGRFPGGADGEAEGAGGGLERWPQPQVPNPLVVVPPAGRGHSLMLVAEVVGGIDPKGPKDAGPVLPDRIR